MQISLLLSSDMYAYSFHLV